MSPRPTPTPFWQNKTLSAMTPEEWESLCDGCGKCCLQKIEFEDTKELCYTLVACRYLDHRTCRCTDYPNRQVNVPNCLSIRDSFVKKQADTLRWLPSSCAYRLLDEGEALPEWHPIITGNPQSTHQSGQSMQHKTISESHVAEEDWEDYMVDDGRW